MKPDLIGDWKSYKIECNSSTILQDGRNFIKYSFNADGSMHSEIKMDNKVLSKNSDSTWDVQNSEGKSFLLIMNYPQYEIISSDKKRLILQGQSGTLTYFTPERDWILMKSKGMSEPDAELSTD